MSKYYTASKVRGVGRESWSIIFRHPVRKDPTGKFGLRVRRGLGTTSETEAQRLVEQMNEILSDPSLWDVSSKPFSLLKYDEKIVAAFYDAMEVKNVDYFKIRDVIALPGSKDGYTRVLIVGTTGAGKTTLLRQLIGTDPRKERFPSTSPNKTTVSDIEVICAEGDYESIVTFFEQREIRMHLEDCVLAAVFAKANGLDEDTVLMRLLEHSEQRFRFFYVLGNPAIDFDDDDEEDVDSEELEQIVTPDERRAFADVIKGHLIQINYLATLSNQVKDQIQKELGIQPDSLDGEDRTAFEEIFEEELKQSKEFHSLVDEMLDEMATRFNSLPGKMELDKDGWPISWMFTTKESERSKFIEAIRRFSSNYAPHFGKLLTPLVQGIRVKGPFKPSWCDSVPKLVFIDGQGLGHTTSTSNSLPSQIKSRINSSDVVLLVDSAKHPMQAASLTALRSLAASGNLEKLRVCFTHLDELKGDNLPNRKSRINHVSASLNQAISHIRETLGHEVAVNLDTVLFKRSYYLANLDVVLQDRDKQTLEQLRELLKDLEMSFLLEVTSSAIPFYDEANLIISVQNATKRFQELWKGRLGYPSLSSEPTEHWTRIKALARRFALKYDNGEYDNMKPISELSEILMEHIRVFLNQPLYWLPSSATDLDKKTAVDIIAQEIDGKLLELSDQKIWADHVSTWLTAYNHVGVGSVNKRKEGIRRLLEAAAPVPGEVGTKISHQYLSDVRQLVRTSIITKGGKLAQ